MPIFPFKAMFYCLKCKSISYKGTSRCETKNGLHISKGAYEYGFCIQDCFSSQDSKPILQAEEEATELQDALAHWASISTELETYDQG